MEYSTALQIAATAVKGEAVFDDRHLWFFPAMPGIAVIAPDDAGQKILAFLILEQLIISNASRASLEAAVTIQKAQTH